MATSPITSFQLFNVPWNDGYKDVVDFPTTAERDAYLQTLTHSEVYTGAQYIEKNGAYNIPLLFDDAERYNYIVYDNNEGNGKVYAFIREKRFISFDCTEITLDTDIWQTYLSLTMTGGLQAFVERRHKDRYDENGVPIFYRAAEFHYEPSVTTLKQTCFSKLNNKTVVWLGILANADVPSVGKFQRGQTLLVLYIPLSVSNIMEPFTVGSSTLSGIEDIPEIVRDPRVLSIFLTPYPPFGPGETLSVIETTFLKNPESGSGAENEKTIVAIGGFSLGPRNISEGLLPLSGMTRGDIVPADMNPAEARSINYEPMLLNKPYHFYRVQESGGESFDIEPYEMSRDHVANLLYSQSGGASGSTFMVRIANDELLSDAGGQFHKIINSKTARLPLRTDAYLNYMLNNASTKNGSVVLGAVMAAAGVGLAYASGGTSLATMAALVQGTGQVSSVASEFMKREDMKKAPDGVRGVGDDALAEYATENYGGVIRIYEYSLPEIDRERLFDYYTMYGYTVNEIEMIDFRSRLYYDYIKTNGLTETDIPNLEDRTNWQNILNNGVTIWHYNGAGQLFLFRNYSLENKERSLMT